MKCEISQSYLESLRYKAYWKWKQIWIFVVASTLKILDSFNSVLSCNNLLGQNIKFQAIRVLQIIQGKFTL